jgi:peptide/nickel transport system ATP-binding protein
MSSPTATSASISLNALCFQYGRAGLFSRRPAPRILHDIDLHVPAGQTIGLVGVSVSGKSTIA